MADKENPIALHLREVAARAEITLGQALTAECERGQMTPEQLEWALDFFANLDQFEEPEATAQLEAWFTWRDETHPGWDSKSPRPAATERSMT